MFGQDAGNTEVIYEEDAVLTKQPPLWRCPNCGQVHFGEDPPDMCDFCQDFTTWGLISGEAHGKPPHRPHTAPAQATPPNPTPAEDQTSQLSLFDD